jgi:histidine triad (HIT) family protein
MVCPFCEIVAGQGAASVVYQDDALMAFMTLRPFAPGECTVIPREHIDHFTDVSDELAQRIIFVAQQIGRRMRIVFSPQRVGMVVHGYGVPHAHSSSSRNTVRTISPRRATPILRMDASSSA